MGTDCGEGEMAVMNISSAKSFGSDKGAHWGLVYFINFPDCLRGIGIKPGSVPPNNAKRLALSRSIKACNPSRTNAVFFMHAGQLNRLCVQIVINIQRGSHVWFSRASD